MRWYQLKEQAAGERRLIVSWFVYKILGKRALQLIAVFVSFFTFAFAPNVRRYSKKNLSVIYKFTKNKNAKPTMLNQYKNVLNYALSLVDKMETFAKKYDIEKIDFANTEEKELFIQLFKEQKGMFFLCSHIGNIDVLRTFIANPKNGIWPLNPRVNVFLSEDHCKVFNGFLKKIDATQNLSTFPVEQINAGTAIEIQERLENGEIAFMAGDRLSAGSSNIVFSANFLNQVVQFPTGTFKLAQLTEQIVFFICAVKEKHDRYKIYLEKFELNTQFNKKQNLKKMQDEYVSFLEKMVNIAPLQFYHFYDLFED